MMHLQKNSSVKEHEFPEDQLPRSQNLLIYGLKAHRFSKKRKSFKPTSLYLLEEDPGLLQWISDSKSFATTRVVLSSIRDITDTPSFSAVSGLFKNPPASGPRHLLCLDLGEELFFAVGFNREEEKLLFWQGLQYQLKSQRDRATKRKSLHTVAKDLFVGYDLDGDQTLSRQEAWNLLTKLHIPLDEASFNRWFKKFDTNGNGSIEFNEFVELMRERLYKPELEKLFKRLSPISEKMDMKAVSEVPMMQFEEIKKFLLKTQKESLTEKQIKEMLNPFFNDKVESRQYKLSYLTFCNLIFSAENSIFDPLKETVYQEMNYPLPQYYCNSSHNTYLLANQLTGESSLQAYINAFMKGCRCVELDCWDGENKEPIVTHGHTLTSKILFADIIDVVKDYGFRQNPYPVILSIENHCHQEQRDRMADILQEKLKDSLFLLPKDWETMKDFPSPNELKYQILIKDKADLVRSNKKPETTTEDCKLEEVSSEDEKDENEEDKALTKEQSTEKTDNKSQKLVKLVTLFGTGMKFHSQREIWNISSLSESQLAKTLSKHQKELILANRYSFTRIFPGGFRVDSSNYDPIQGFMAGSQVIALNFQTNDMNLMLYLSKFMENGGIYSGYVLKPAFLREGDVFYSDFLKPKLEVVVKVKTAQFLRPLKQEDQVGDVIDPFVEVAIRGMDKDCKSERTGTVKNNGLNPNFKGKNNRFVFNLHCPDVAMLVFSVFDENKLKNERVAWYALPVSCVRQGYRVVPLRNCVNLDFFELSSIYVKIEVRRI